MQVPDLVTIEKTTRIILQIGGIIIGLLIVLGYIFYIGRRVGNGRVLRETPPYEFKMELGYVGTLFLMIFSLILIASSLLYFYFEPSKEEILNFVVLVTGISVWILYFAIVFKERI